MEEEQQNGGISVKGEESSSKTPELIIPEAAHNNRELDVNGTDMDGNKTTGDLQRKASSSPFEAEAAAVVAAKKKSKSKSKSNAVGSRSFIPYHSKTTKLIIPEAAHNNRELDVNGDDMDGNKTTGDLQRKASSSPFEAEVTAVVAAKKGKRRAFEERSSVSRRPRIKDPEIGAVVENGSPAYTKLPSPRLRFGGFDLFDLLQSSSPPPSPRIKAQFVDESAASLPSPRNEYFKVKTFDLKEGDGGRGGAKNGGVTGQGVEATKVPK